MSFREYQSLMLLLNQIEQDYKNKSIKSKDHHTKKYNFHAVGISREIKERIKEHLSGKIRCDDS